VDLSSPLLLGRYALYDRIAAGGMATVHLGRLLGPVGFSRTVAIKRLQPQFAEDPEFVSMFLDEARLAARIRHPNVVPTLDVVSTQRELFLVMEYVQGDSMARLLRTAHARGDVPPPALLATLMVGVLNGLHAAHEARSEQGEPLGIVHRDVSPQNIIVGIDGVARVLDFGVAKAVGRLQTTRDGQLKGKLAYMAPEQLRGSVTRASDIYSASIVLWEALVGRRAFVGETEGELFAKVLAGRLGPPGELVSGIPPALDAAIVRGADPDPAKRFATARDMARAVAEAVSLVDTTVIGEWVESVAKPTLDSRSDLIATIESDSTLRALPPGPSDSDASAPPPRRDDPPPKAGVDIALAQEDALSTQLSSGSVSVGARMVTAPPAAWRHGAMGAGAVVLVLGAWLAISSLIHQAPPPTTTAAAAAPLDSSPLPAVAASPNPPSTGTPVEPTSPPPATQPTASAVTRAVSTPASPPSARTVAPAGRRVAPSSSAPAASCNPPYYFQGGARIFKTECL
jgi:eukaryotic-like serine/threonine-protein kinase